MSGPSRWRSSPYSFPPVAVYRKGPHRRVCRKETPAFPSAPRGGYGSGSHDRVLRSSCPLLTAQVVADLRSTRRRRRLGDTEWGELAYRVYTTAFFVLVVVIMISGAVGDEPVSGQTVVQVRDRGPAWAGLALAAMLLAAVRSGSRGGPLALEAADVQHLLLSPVDRGATLRRPTAGVLGYGIFTGTAVMAVTGSLLSQRLPGGTAEFVWSGSLFGAVITASALGAALLTASRIAPRWVMIAAGWLLLAWSVADVADRSSTAPTTLAGDLLFWPMRRGTPGLVWVVAAVVLVAAGVRLIGGLSIEAARRRTLLVGQLRFAVTQQDLRSVVLLRRQLASEVPRNRRWFPVPAALGRRVPVFAGISRASATGQLSASRGFSCSQSRRHSPPARCSREPLHWSWSPGLPHSSPPRMRPRVFPRRSITHTLLESLPQEPGEVMLHHLAAPLVVLVSAGLVGSGCGVRVRPGNRGVAGRPHHRAHRLVGSSGGLCHLDGVPGRHRSRQRRTDDSGSGRPSIGDSHGLATTRGHRGVRTCVGCGQRGRWRRSERGCSHHGSAGAPIWW